VIEPEPEPVIEPEPVVEPEPEPMVIAEPVEIIFMGEVITPKADPDPPVQKAVNVDYRRNRGRVPGFPVDCNLTFFHDGETVEVVDRFTMNGVSLFPRD
jgi:hypothetical protein